MRSKRDDAAEVRPAFMKPTKAQKAERSGYWDTKPDMNVTMRGLSGPDNTHILRRAGKSLRHQPRRSEAE